MNTTRIVGILLIAAGTLGLILWNLGEYGRARSLFREALALREATGNPLGQALALGNLGNVSLAAGDTEQAFALYGSALTLVRTVGAVRSPGLE